MDWVKSQLPEPLNLYFLWPNYHKVVGYFQVTGVLITPKGHGIFFYPHSAEKIVWNPN